MIDKISISNYKSIKKLDFNIGKLNILIGENGCGKTNILEAIACCSIAADTESSQLSEAMMSLRGIRTTEPNLMYAAFDEAEKVINIEISNEKAELFGINIYDHDNHGNWTAGLLMNTTEDTRNYVEELRKKSTFLPKYKPYLDKIFNSKNTISSFLNFAPENYFLRRFEEEGQVKPLGIRGEGLFKHLVDIYKKNPELLEKIGNHLKLIGWFKGFEIPKDLMFTERRINIKDKYLQHLESFDQRSANEGFLYMLCYFTLFISPYTPKFFAIDNIDNALNPKLCAELIRQLAVLVKENNKQVILTTHNPAILDGLDLTDDNQRLFTVYRNADGHTTMKRVKAPKKVKGVEPVRLSEAFIRGYLGGLPKNF